MMAYEDEEQDSVGAGLRKIATSIKYLGGGDNADQRGAVEVMSIGLNEGLKDVAVSVRGHGRAVATALDNCADAVRGLKIAICKLAEAVTDDNRYVQDDHEE